MRKDKKFVIISLSPWSSIQLSDTERLYYVSERHYSRYISKVLARGGVYVRDPKIYNICPCIVCLFGGFYCLSGQPVTLKALAHFLPLPLSLPLSTVLLQVVFALPNLRFPQVATRMMLYKSYCCPYERHYLFFFILISLVFVVSVLRCNSWFDIVSHQFISKASILFCLVRLLSKFHCRKLELISLENHRPVASHWQTLSHNFLRVHLVWAGFELTTLVVISTDCICCYKPDYHRITTTTTLH